MGIARQIVAEGRQNVANDLQIVAKRSKETPKIKYLLETIFDYSLVDDFLALMYKFTHCCHLCYKI